MTTTLRAKVTGWTDIGSADRFEDEHGNTWFYVADAADGTIAVERPYGLGAGVFVWEVGTEDGGRINTAEDGDCYGIDTPAGEYVARKGEWVPQI